MQLQSPSSSTVSPHAWYYANSQIRCDRCKGPGPKTLCISTQWRQRFFPQSAPGGLGFYNLLLQGQTFEMTHARFDTDPTDPWMLLFLHELQRSAPLLPDPAPSLPCPVCAWRSCKVATTPPTEHPMIRRLPGLVRRIYRGVPVPHLAWPRVQEGNQNK